MIRLFCLLAFIASSAQAVTITLPFADFADEARVAKTGDIMSGPLTASSFTTTGSGMIGMALLGTTTKTYVGGGIGYFDYTQSAATMTDATNNIIIFSTLTVPANAFTRKGQQLKVSCNYNKSTDANSVTARILFNNAGTYTAISSGTSTIGSSGQVPFHEEATLNWQAASLWNWTNLQYQSTTLFAGQPSPPVNQTFDETKTMTFNCACNSNLSGNIIVGQCKFIDMRMEWGGM